MTYAPADIAAIRSYLIDRLDLVKGVARGADLEAGEVGIVGDPAHAASGGYHEGNDDLSRVGHITSDYSKRESARDWPGTNAASALDIGDFDVTRDGRRGTLRTLTAAIVDACRRGDPRCRDVREVIWSPDGSTVQRWDRLGLRSTGDGTHRWHSHISFFRDAEGRRHLDDNFLGLLKAVVGGANTPNTLEDPMQPDERNWLIEAAVAAREIPRIKADLATIKSRPAVDAAAVAAAMTADVSFITSLATAVAAQVTQQAGASAEQVRKIVDEELDEQAMGGADKDT